MGFYREFTMSQEQLDALLDACKPTPAMFISGGQSLMGTPQENANRAWEKLGKEMGFKHMTVSPSGKGQRTFNAEPTEAEE